MIESKYLAKEESRNYPFNLVYRLNNIIRFSNIPRISDESVTTHMYHTAIIVVELFLEYEFNLERALLMAVCHDIPETEVDDISHATKRKFPDVAKALKAAEKQLIQDYPQLIKDAITEFEFGASLESEIVKIADAQQCYQFASYEIHNLGNKSEHMRHVMESSLDRVVNGKKLLGKYRRTVNV
jgi:5'-deoxynucleotidase YfbR-like HD superfamily hydrolase